jgi:hypothetical protein
MGVSGRPLHLFCMYAYIRICMYNSLGDGRVWQIFATIKRVPEMSGDC